MKQKNELLMLKSAVENANDSVIITTPDLDRPGPKIIYVNPAFTKMTGYTKEEALGRSPRFLQGKRTDRKILDLMKKELPKKGIFRNEIVNYKKNGKEYFIEWHVSAIKDEKGRLTNWMSIQRDITKRKEMEVNLRKTNEKIEKEVKKRTRQLEKLKEKLEMKVRKLERKDIDLTEKEMRIFLSMIEHPEQNDNELSEDTGIRRPTVTAIRNRLRKRRWYDERYIPNFQAIGAEMINISHGKDAVSEISKRFGIIDKRFREPETVLLMSTHNDHMSINIARDFSEARRFNTVGRNETSEMMALKDCNIARFMDFSESIAELFGLKERIVHSSFPNKKLKPLKENERSVLIEITKDAYKTNKDISKSTGISQPTVSKIKESLYKKGYVRKVIIPNIKMLSCHIVFIEIEFNKDKKKDTIKNRKDQISSWMNEFVRIEQGNNLYMLSMFKDFPEKEVEFSDELEKMYEEEDIIKYPEFLVMHPRQIKFNSIDFSRITEKLMKDKD